MHLRRLDFQLDSLQADDGERYGLPRPTLGLNYEVCAHASERDACLGGAECGQSAQPMQVSCNSVWRRVCTHLLNGRWGQEAGCRQALDERLGHHQVDETVKRCQLIGRHAARNRMEMDSRLGTGFNIMCPRPRRLA